jgi:hypothetical protein
LDFVPLFIIQLEPYYALRDKKVARIAAFYKPVVGEGPAALSKKGKLEHTNP